MAPKKKSSGKGSGPASPGAHKKKRGDSIPPSDEGSPIAVQPAPGPQAQVEIEHGSVSASEETLSEKISESSSPEKTSLQIDEEPPAAEEPASRALQEEEVELLAFYLAGEEYAVDIMIVQEITKFVEVTPIPRVPPYIKGIVTLRGNVIPVFDMHRRLHLAPFQKKSKSRFIIGALKEGMAAMMVDEITEVVRLKKSRLEPPPPGIAAHDVNFIEKIGRLENRLFILLNMNEVLKIGH